MGSLGWVRARVSSSLLPLLPDLPSLPSLLLNSGQPPETHSCTVDPPASCIAVVSQHRSSPPSFYLCGLGFQQISVCSGHQSSVAGYNPRPPSPLMLSRRLPSLSRSGWVSRVRVSGLKRWGMKKRRAEEYGRVGKNEVRETEWTAPFVLINFLFPLF